MTKLYDLKGYTGHFLVFVFISNLSCGGNIVRPLISFTCIFDAVVQPYEQKFSNNLIFRNGAREALVLFNFFLIFLLETGTLPQPTSRQPEKKGCLALGSHSKNDYVFLRQDLLLFFT